MKLEVGKKYRIDITELPYKLVAIDKYDVTWGLVEGVMYSRKKCDIIGEWQDKPNPGEGWRLLEVGEKLQEGDQFYNSVADWVGACLTWSGGVVQNGSVYRRRIAPQYVPYTWDDREELRGKWFKIKGDEVEFQAYEFNVDQDKFYINSILAKDLFEYWEYLDGSPCGKKVV
jgi:hypothetical protein